MHNSEFCTNEQKYQRGKIETVLKLAGLPDLRLAGTAGAKNVNGGGAGGGAAYFSWRPLVSEVERNRSNSFA